LESFTADQKKDWNKDAMGKESDSAKESQTGSRDEHPKTDEEGIQKQTGSDQCGIEIYRVGGRLELPDHHEEKKQL